MTLRELQQQLPALALEGEAEVEVLGLTHDSRRVQAGYLYVALPGRRFDGRAFIEDALARGAVALALPAEGPGWPGAPVLRLPQPRRDLAHLAAALHAHPGRKMALVGVTGTNGKSTVAWLFGAIVEAAGHAAGLVGTIEHRLGATVEVALHTTPEAPELQALLARMHGAGVRHAIMEVSSIGLSERRVDGLAFDAAAFLNLSPDHLDYHADMGDYGAAKARLFGELLAPEAQVIIDVDDAFGAELAESVPAWRFSLEGPADLYYEGLALDARGIRGRLITPHGEIPLQSPLLGLFNARNAAVAAGLALAVGLPIEAIQRGLACASVPGRMERVAGPDNAPATVVDYAHSPDAIERALKALRPLTAGRLWCLFGCGGDRDRSKRPAMGEAAALADGVVVTSDNPRSEDPAAIAAAALEGAVKAGRPLADRPRPGASWVELDRAAAIEGLIHAAEARDTILLAGKGHETYQEVAGVRRPFDDREIAARALGGLA